MIREITICVLAACDLSSVALADTSLALGRAISQMDDVHIEETPEERCSDNYICLRSWSRWTLHIEHTLVGPAVRSGRVHVVMMQHSPMVDSVFKRKLLFVLEHIGDATERKRLHADYKLVEFTQPNAMYCTSGDPRQWGIPPDRIYSHGVGDDVSYCFPDPRSS